MDLENQGSSTESTVTNGENPAQFEVSQPEPSLASRLQKKFEEVSKKSEPATQEEPAAAEASQGEEDKTAEAASPEVKTEAPAPAFQPNWKVKVMDKELEIPEAFRALMKDEKTEKEVREIFEKAYGLDVVKTKHIELRGKLQNTEKELGVYKGGISELRQIYQKGDFDGFFERLQIPQQEVLQWVLEKVNYSQLPPEQRQVLDEKKRAERQADQLEKQSASSQQNYEKRMQQVTASLLESALARDDVRKFAADFDARVGKPDSFRERVIDQGELAFMTSEEDWVDPNQVVSQVMTQYGPFIAGNAQSPAASPISEAAAPAQQQTVVATPAKPTPTIPNVSGRASSPMKNKPKSLDDLKQLAKNFQG